MICVFFLFITLAKFEFAWATLLCWRRFDFVKNFCSQLEQECWATLLCVKTCFLKLSLREKVFWHISHEKLVCFKWIFLWRLSSSRLQNFRSQSSHANYFSLLCDFLCLFKSLFLENFWLHCWHSNGFSLVCVFTCWLKTPLCLKLFWQCGHTWKDKKRCVLENYFKNNY